MTHAHINSDLIPPGATVLDLSQVISPASPHMKGSQPPFQMSLWTTADRTQSVLRRQGVKNEPGVNVELANMTFHVGTHVDALGHFACGARMYDGRETDRVVGDLGLRDLDAAQIPPIIGRGLLIDVAHLDGEDCLKGGRPISDADLAAQMARDGTRVEPGDIVLVRTGWGRFYGDPKSGYAHTSPGLTLEAARLLTGAGAFAIGADNMAVEVIPHVDPAVVMPVHIHTLVDCGVYLIENLVLDELAAHGARTFTFVMLPLKIRGATGCPVRPLAVLPPALER